MRKFILAGFAALSLAACSTGAITPATVTDLVCKDGKSVADVVNTDKERVAARAPELDVFVSKIVNAEVAGKLSEGKADMVVILTAVDRNTNKPAPFVHVLFVKDGCVILDKFVDKEAAEKALTEVGA